MEAASRRRVWWGVGTFIFLVVALCAWIGARAYLARKHLLEAKNEISLLRAQVSNGDVSGLTAGLAKVRHDAHAAKSLTGDFIWQGLAALPLLGRTLGVGHSLASSVEQLADQALPPLEAVSHQLDPHNVRRADGSINVGLLASAAPDLARSRSAIGPTTRQVDGLNVRGVLGPVVNAREQLLSQLKSLDGTVDMAYRAARIGPDMLGAQGTRRYLLVFQNPAESRGTGGLIGSYAVIRVTNGKVTRERTGSNTELVDSPTAVIDFGREFSTRYANTDEALAWRNANFTPHFPYAAEIWQRLWLRQTGQRLDGVIAVDPVALGYLLAVTGPVRLSDGEVITGSNAATWSMVTSYARYATDNERRKQLAVELARKTLDLVSSGTGDSTALLQAMGRAAGQGRLLAWSAHPAEEAVLSGTPIAGELPNAPGPFTALIVRNRSGDKLDYYLKRRLDYRVLSCSSEQRVVQVTATLTNDAPQSGLPGLVTARVDNRKVPVGENRLVVDLYATRGSVLKQLLLNGKPAAPFTATERGVPVYQADIELPIGQPQTLTLVATEPRAAAPLRYLIQPLAQPLQLTVQDRCP